MFAVEQFNVALISSYSLDSFTKLHIFPLGYRKSVYLTWIYYVLLL